MWPITILVTITYADICSLKLVSVVNKQPFFTLKKKFTSTGTYFGVIQVFLTYRITDDRFARYLLNRDVTDRWLDDDLYGLWRYSAHLVAHSYCRGVTEKKRCTIIKTYVHLNFAVCVCACAKCQEWSVWQQVIMFSLNVCIGKSCCFKYDNIQTRLQYYRSY